MNFVHVNVILNFKNICTSLYEKNIGYEVNPSLRILLM